MPLLGHHAYFFLDHQSNLSMKYAKQILQHIFLVHHAYYIFKTLNQHVYSNLHVYSEH